MNDYNNVLVGFSELIKNEEFRPYDGDLRLGVDLGTANIVVSVVDSNNTPIAGASYPSTVVRDGIVVDFMGASRAVRNMKAKLEDLMGVEFYEAATAVPPGIISGNVKVISNVVESVGLDVINVVDEPTAAASVLGITNGAVVDVGGGTTGISILKDGEVIFTADEPTGGTHMTLVLAGSLGCSFEEAERIKKDPKQEMLVFPVVKPVIEKMAAIVARFIQGYDVDGSVIKIARRNAREAGVDHLIHFQERDVKDLSHPKKYGFIITNPPYGERLEDKKDLPALYKAFGESFKNLDSWSAYMITSYEDAERYFGRKADRNRKIYNGMLKTYFYQFLGPKPPKARRPEEK